MGTFKKKPVEVEAVRFTGDNWDEMHAFTGHSEITFGRKQDTFAPTDVGGSLWVAANRRWLPIEPGEWVLRDEHGFHPCKDDGTGEAPMNYESA